VRTHAGRLSFIGRGLSRAVVLFAGLAIILGLAAAVMLVRSEFGSSDPSVLEQDEERLQEAILEDPNDPDLRVSLANVYLEGRRYDEAIAQYNEVLKADENRQDALIGLGLAYRDKGDSDQALSAFNKLVEVTEGSEFAGVDRRLEAVHYYLGEIYLERNEPAKAVEELQAALKIEPTDADALYLLGNALQAQGEYDGAIAVYAVATSLVPDFREAYEGMAAAAEKQDDALIATYARAMIRLFSGDPRTAVRDLEDVTGQSPENAAAYFGLGYGYEQLGERDKALAAYRQSTEIDPSQYAAQSALARLGSE
jgi:tetratricopeptide (TPR) repeat protein